MPDQKTETAAEVLATDIRNLIVMDTQYEWRGSTKLKHEDILRLEARGWVAEGNENNEYDLTDEGRAVVERALSAQGEALDTVMRARGLPAVKDALGYSRNFAEANPNLTQTAKDHITGLCDMLEIAAAHSAQTPEAQGEAVASPLDLSAPPKVWLQIDPNGDAEDRSEAIPRAAWDDLSWNYESIGGQEVEYVRADLAHPAPARVTEVGKLAPVAFAGSDGKPAWIHDGNGVGVSTAVPFKTVLYALTLPDGVLVRNGPLGVLATDDEAQAMRLAHVRDADGPPTIVRYLYAGTWRDWNNAGRESPAERVAVPHGPMVPSTIVREYLDARDAYDQAIGADKIAVSERLIYAREALTAALEADHG